MTSRVNPFAIVALVSGLLLAVGSVLYWGVALTFGGLSGLVVLLAPAYPLLAQPLLAAFVTSVCWWRGWRWTGLGLGLVAVLGPAAALVGWYVRELWTCERAADPAACFAYLNGSPLLPGLVALAALVSLGEAVGLGVATWLVGPRAREPDALG